MAARFADLAFSAAHAAAIKPSALAANPSALNRSPQLFCRNSITFATFYTIRKRGAIAGGAQSPVRQFRLARQKEHRAAYHV